MDDSLRMGCSSVVVSYSLFVSAVFDCRIVYFGL